MMYFISKVSLANKIQLAETGQCSLSRSEIQKGIRKHSVQSELACAKESEYKATDWNIKLRTRN